MSRKKKIALTIERDHLIQEAEDYLLYVEDGTDLDTLQEALRNHDDDKARKELRLLPRSVRRRLEIPDHREILFK